MNGSRGIIFPGSYRSAKTVNGQSVTIKTVDGKVLINGSTVVKADIAATNGTIHVIDTVLMPK
jgi:uncharacterized surface protein with fasciclin (FAS1) repeats